jgi:hypothetical protein
MFAGVVNFDSPGNPEKTGGAALELGVKEQELYNFPLSILATLPKMSNMFLHSGQPIDSIVQRAKILARWLWN